MDEDSIREIQVNIVEVKEMVEDGGLKLKYWVYVLLITRNDGLQWFIEKRFSEISQFRESLMKENSSIEELPFPKKNFLKYTSKLLSSFTKDYKKDTMERKAVLQEFFKKVAKMKERYESKVFLFFFSPSK